MTTNPKLPVAVFLSGSGRTLANLIVHRDQHDLPIEIRLVIGSKLNLRGLQIATAANLRTLVVQKSAHPSAEDYCRAMFDPCREKQIKLVVMAGFLKHVLIPDDFVDRVMNIHPSLLPKFGGRGMYGDRVHQAVLDAGESQSGCTVHMVNNEYDQGPIVLQRKCEVVPGDTSESLAARVFQEECQALPEAIRQFADGACRIGTKD